jgi:hypothetical protein
MKHQFVVHAFAIFLAATGVARPVAVTHETTDTTGRFAIKVHRGYLDKDAEETEFRIGYLKASRGQAELIEMGKKGSKEPLALKIKKDVEKLDLGEIW